MIIYGIDIKDILKFQKKKKMKFGGKKQLNLVILL